ncbi:MAG: histidinol phosphate phosphatase [Betaproteobacteria bacterium HGW-Betaproteobacteria-12]|nr:MAG: histidinol phosphate phosphatase [Betaproteobacteria bacterium HGW-Betaproteobacteria-12]
MELSKLSLSELKNLLTLIPAEIKKREKEEKIKTLKEVEAFAAERGFSLEELVGNSAIKTKKEKSTVAVKYRHPEKADLTWTGRGRQPKWTAEFLATGGTLEQLAV